MNKSIILSMLVTVILCFGVTSSFAKLYSDAPYGQGTSTIGTGGDYPSLYAASVDFSTTANTGPWVIQILNSLNETSESFWGNYVPPSSSVTIEPAPGVNAIVTYTATTIQETNAILGQLIVGLNNATTFTLASVCNFTINGSNNGTNSQNLTFLRPDVGYSNNYMLRIIGACPNFTLENCSVLNRYATETTASGATTEFTGYGIYIDIDVVATGNDWEPDGFQILNNYIEVTAGGYWYQDTRAIYCGNNQGVGLTSGTDHMPNNFVISGNTLLGCNRTVYFYRSENGTISNNTILTIHPVDVEHGGGLPIGLWTGYNNAGTYGPLVNGYQGTQNIYGNYFENYAYDTSANATDDIAIALDGRYMIYNIYNNEILVKYAGTGVPINTEVGIYLDLAVSPTGSVINILNNSMDIPNNPLLSNNTSGRYGFGIYDPVTGFNLNIENNLFRIGQAGGYGYDIYSTGSNQTTVCDYNTFYVDTTMGCVAGRLSGLADYTTFDAWTSNGTGYDANGQFLDPDTMTGAWVSDSNFSFTAIPTQLLSATTSLPFPITTDFFGNLRSTTAPYRGAVEVTGVQYNPAPVVTYQNGTSVTITLSGGEPPYSLDTSALDASIGFVDTTTGSSIVFTPGSIITTGTFITAIDSFGQTVPVMIEITVNADVKDWMLMSAIIAKPNRVTRASQPPVQYLTMDNMDQERVLWFNLFQ